MHEIPPPPPPASAPSPPPISAGTADPALPQPESAPQQAPKRSRKGLWIGLAGAAVLILAAAATTVMLLLGNSQRAGLEAEYDEAANDLSAVLQSTSGVAGDAGRESNSARKTAEAVTDDLVADPAVLSAALSAAEFLEERAGLLLVVVETSGSPIGTNSAEGIEFPGSGEVVPWVEFLPEEELSALSDDELIAATTAISERTEEVHTLLADIEQGRAQARDAQAAVFASVQANGAGLLTEASELLSTEEIAILQAALDAFSGTPSADGGLDVAAAVAELEWARESVQSAVQAAMAPQWEDLDGTWCGGSDDQCITIELPRSGTSTLSYSKMVGECFSGMAAPDNGVGGAMVLFCPAGVPTSVENDAMLQHGPFVMNEDESRDRVLFYQAAGGYWFFRQ